MNILLMNGLPYEYEGIPLSADFRNMINAELILHDEDIPESEKWMQALNQLYAETPADAQQALDGFTWFFHRGKAESGGKQVAHKGKGFDFNQDASMIFAAFYGAYNISLSTIDFLHWWEFMALFEGLPDDTMIKRAMYYRTADTTGMGKAEKKHVEKMRGIFQLKGTEKAPISIEDLNQQTKDRVARRLAEANRLLEERKGM